MKPCLGPKCEKIATRRGLCNGHYEQVRRGHPLAPISPRSGEFLRLGPQRYYADWSLRKKYGIGIEEMERRARTQNNTCPISLLPLTKTPCVDHIGTLGQPNFVIRGLLTRQANLMLGHLESLEALGANLKIVAAPHVYEYIMRGRSRQEEQIRKSQSDFL